MLTLMKLRDPEYLLSQVALGIEDYYVGSGEAPGVWHGRWAGQLGLTGVVDADQLRALVEGLHPKTGADLLAGRPERAVNAFDATLSAPKSASLLWAFGDAEVSSAVSIAHVEAVAVALDFLESKAAVARQQVGGVRSRVATAGFAVATFVHRTSRAGDPQMHTHCLIPNVVCRPDGSHVALDAGPLHEWAKAAGSIYQEELRRRLTERLGVAWGPDRNGCREMVGFSDEQLRTFSKRTVAIEEYLGSLASEPTDPATRMRADDAASLATRLPKDRSLTPEVLRERWEAEVVEVDLPTGTALAAQVCGRALAGAEVTPDEVLAHLLDPEEGLCARSARFGEAHVVEAVAALGAGRLDVEQIAELSATFLASDHAVRLVGREPEDGRRRPPQWSTTAHLALERRALAGLDTLAATRVAGIDPAVVERALATEASALGEDQAAAVRALCAPGPALRALVAPAGFGKTTAVHAGAVASLAAERHVLGLATTNQAVGELRAVGLPAMTLARFTLELERSGGLEPDTTLILDEVSQVATADVAVVFAALAGVPAAQLWCLGDAAQAQAVRAGGLAAEVERMGREGRIPAPVLTVNRRQLDPAEREALARYREGDVAGSQAIRTEHGWEHDLGTPLVTRQAMSKAVVVAADAHGPEAVMAFAVSHADCEDLADRIRAIYKARGELGGPTLRGPAWAGGEREYALGDRVLLHAPRRSGGVRLRNGSVLTVTGVSEDGLTVSDDAGRGHLLPSAFVAGRRPGGDPNCSHAWARTVDGAQGGTWRQVHLLGTAALDRFTGYVGQSRSQMATHTWNVKRLSDVDHGGVLADRREAGEEVLSGLERLPDPRFAAHDDPYEVDGRLSADRADHLAVLANRPPPMGAEFGRVRRDLERAEESRYWAQYRLDYAIKERAALGALHRLRRSGREEAATLDDRIARFTDDVARDDKTVVGLEHELARLQAAEAQSIAFDVTQGWRQERVAEIDATLAHHWAGVVLSAVREDDPLAFGIERLLRARTTYARDLQRLEDSLPPDRRRALAQGEAELRYRQASLEQTGQRLEHTRAAPEQAGIRRWGRRDKAGLEAAQRDLRAAEADLGHDEQRVAEAQAEVDQERVAVGERQRALEATAELRQTCSQALDELDHALRSIRSDRGLGISREAPADGWERAVDAPCRDLEAEALWEEVAGLSPGADSGADPDSYRVGQDRGALGLGRSRTPPQAEWPLPGVEPPGPDLGIDLGW